MICFMSAVTRAKCHIGPRLPRESLAEEAETMASSTKKLECADCHEVDDHEDELIDSGILDSFVPHARETKWDLIRDYM